MFRKKYFFLLFLLLLMLGYISLVFVFNYSYSQERWIPKIILKIPDYTVLAKNENAQLKPDVFPSVQDDFSVNVLFDTTGLDVIDMVRPWSEEKNALETYSKKIQPTEKNKLAIILTNVGANDDLFWQSIYKLPPSITLSFSPYTDNLSEKINAVRKNGFENMFDIVVEGENAYDNGGMYALNDTSTEEQINQILQEQYLNLNVPFVGFWADYANQVNSSFKSVSPFFWENYGIFTLRVEDVFRFVKQDFYEKSIAAHLNDAEIEATKTGQSIIVFPMHPLVVKVLTRWIGMHFNSDVEIVPLSAIVQEVL